MMDVKIGDRIFKLEKPSGYKLLKVVDQGKDAADLMRDLILICVKEPSLTTGEVESMDAETFFTLSAKVNELLADDLKNLQELMKSNVK